MTDVKHTPGEWFVWSDDNGAYHVGPSINLKVASLWQPVLGHAGTNARLIAAAPDLLEALKMVLGKMDDWNQDGPTIQAIKATIAKAEGRE